MMQLLVKSPAGPPLHDRKMQFLVKTLVRRSLHDSNMQLLFKSGNQVEVILRWVQPNDAVAFRLYEVGDANGVFRGQFLRVA